MVTDRELTAMMADGLLNTVRDAAKGLYGDNQAYPCDDVKRMADEVDKLRRLRAELLDKLHGTPCAEIRWQQERETLVADNERLRAALERAESNFYNAANALDDYDYRGPVPGRNGPVVAHRAEFHAAMVEQLDGYAKQCFAALTAQPAEGEKA